MQPATPETQQSLACELPARQGGGTSNTMPSKRTQMEEGMPCSSAYRQRRMRTNRYGWKDQWFPVDRWGDQEGTRGGECLHYVLPIIPQKKELKMLPTHDYIPQKEDNLYSDKLSHCVTGKHPKVVIILSL